MLQKYFYQGREVQLVGQLGDSIYEIKDPSGRLNRGQTFSVAIAQVDIRSDSEPTNEPSEPKSRKKSSNGSAS
jgi:hypothetical protein